MTLEDFLKWEGHARSIDFKAEYAQICDDDHHAAILLSQILYWNLPISRGPRKGKTKLTIFREGRYWLSKTKNQWFADTRLNRDKFDHAISVLEAKGLIEVRTFHFKNRPALHISFDIAAFFDLLDSILRV